MTIPTLEQLNDETCSHNQLLILRALNTSDFTFSYMLFKTETLKDILKVTRALVNQEPDELSDEERAEFDDLSTDIQAHINNQGG